MVYRRAAFLAGGLIFLLSLVAGLAVASPHRVATIAPSVWASPREIDFGPVGLGIISDPIVVTFTNNGDTFLAAFSGGEVGAPFLREQTCDVGLPAATTCSYTFRFVPDQPGEFVATSLTQTDAGPVEIVLRGRGVGPELVVWSRSLDLGSVIVGQTAAPQMVSVRNSGRSHLTILEITDPGGPFSVTPDCAGGVAQGNSCSVQFGFAPDAAGTFTATTVISTTGGLATVELVGSGRVQEAGSVQRVSPRIIDLGPVGIGFTRFAPRVTVYNQSLTDDLSDWEPVVVYSPFDVASTCIDDIGPGMSCYYDFTFAPTSTGPISTTATISNSAGTVDILLQGEGVGPEITADALTLEFPPVPPFSTSPQQTVTFRNTGRASLPAMYGGAPQPPIFGASTTCGGELILGETCEVYYTFDPIELGHVTGVSQLGLDPAATESITINLMGGRIEPGLQLSFEPEAIKPGETATLRIAIPNPNASQPLLGLILDGDLPPGLVVADDPMIVLGPDCYSGSFQPLAGGSTLPFSGAVLGSRTCELAVKVTAADEATYDYTATILSDSGPSAPATATLTVSTEPVPVVYRLYLPMARR